MKTMPIKPKTRTLLVTLGGFALLAILLICGALRGSRSVAAELVTTSGERVEFLRECGWEVDPASEAEQTVHIPERFSAVYESYNDLQKQQGYDLEPLGGTDCTLYTYTVTNWPDDGQLVVADLYVRNDRVIGGDVHSTNLDGFMIGIK